MRDFYSDYRDYFLFGLSIVLFLCLSFIMCYYFRNSIYNLDKKIKERPVVEVKNDNKSDDEQLIVDIKGEVKRPGVYFLDKGKRVIDVVNKAGGFTKQADSSVNNLSKKITDEMVIVIYSKSQVEEYAVTKEKEQNVIEKCNTEKIVNNSCVESNKSIGKATNESKNNSTTKSKTVDESPNESKKVSINTASKEELMTLTGIGESKAIAIIEYRSNKKFETIEEIKEVSGIGDALFEKIKDYITT